MIDALALAQALIRRPSVTPKDAGALDVLEAALKELGFTIHHLPFGDIDNLYARLGDAAPHFCFAGHTDVVPVGEGWKQDPFAAEVKDGMLYGRGAADMKSAIAAFVAAVAKTGTPKGSISLLITGDEEGAAINGTVKLLEWLKARGEKIDHCVVGEPTSVGHAGDTLKIGRRGSINFRVTVTGMQGHVGYPQKAKNPIPALAELVTQLASHNLDKGTAHFDPSTLAFTTLDVGNDTTNVIPGEARAGFNIRFNDKHTPDSLTNWVNDRATRIAQQSGCQITVTAKTSGVAFLTAPGKFTQLVSDTIAGITGQSPFFSTSGGTSDARFIKDFCPVVELGLAGATMHKADECVAVAEIAALTDIYAALLAAYFAKPPLLSSQPIGIFDSGMGGLTVMRALKARLPRESFVYLGDTARLPYGTKSADTVTRYAVQASAALMAHDIKLLVVACNTASAAAVPMLTQALAPLPVIGVIEPGAQAAVAAAPDGPIAIIATEGTVRGGAYVQAIQALAPHMPVVQQACPLFVALAEEGLTSGPIAQAVAHRYLDPLLATMPRPRGLVLGCTHFPVLKETIALVAGDDVVLIDSAETTAAAVEGILKSRHLLHAGTAQPPRFLATDAPGRFAHLGEIFLGEPIDPGSVMLVDL